MNSRFPFLSSLIAALRVFGVLILIGVAIAAIGFFSASFDARHKSEIVAGLFSLAMGFFSAISCFVSAEICAVFLAIESNTRSCLEAILANKNNMGGAKT